MSRWEDTKTAAQIKLSLMANHHVGGLEIRVKAVNGIVFLSGYVQDHGKRELAEAIAGRHSAVYIVKNDIEVLGDEDTTPDPIDIQDPRSISSRSPEDRALANRVLGNLECDSRINTYMINVDALNGVVYLGGLQDDRRAGSRAEEIARMVPGVVTVVNEIRTREAP